jgi:hypothetical protein
MVIWTIYFITPLSICFNQTKIEINDLDKLIILTTSSLKLYLTNDTASSFLYDFHHLVSLLKFFSIQSKTSISSGLLLNLLGLNSKMK